MTGVEVLDPREAFIARLEAPNIRPGTDGLRDDGEVILEQAEPFGESVPLTFQANVVVGGRDTRVTGEEALRRAEAGVTRTGAAFIDCGILPTPAVSWITRGISKGEIIVPGLNLEYPQAAGIVVTASHNKPSDNGLKAFDGSGLKPDELAEQRLVFFLNNPDVRDAAIGTAVDDDEDHSIIYQADYLRGAYEASLIDGVRQDLFVGRKVVVDAGFGAAFQTAPDAFDSLGADVVKVACEPNGEEINVAYGATHPDATAREVRESGADFGVAFDGDADRVMLVSKEGRVLNGDRMLLILAMADMKRSNPGEVTKVVGTVMRNEGFLHALKTQAEARDRQVEFYETAVGDTAVARKMAEENAHIGGEQSGHILLNGEAGDGVRAAIQVMKALDELEMTLDEAYDLMEDFPQVLQNAEMPDTATRERVVESAELQALELEIQTELAELGIEGRTLLRESKTEKLIRAMVELEPGHEELAAQLAARMVDRAHELAWPNDLEEAGVMTYGDKQFRVTVGRGAKLVGAIIEGSKEEEMGRKVPKDAAERFPNRAAFETWYQKGRHLVAFWNEDGSLAEIIWHGESPIEKEIAGLLRKGAELDFLDRIPQGSHDTFAIRAYEGSRHQKVPGEASFARKSMGVAQELYEQRQVEVGRPVEHIWLETNLYDEKEVDGEKVTVINGSVFLYHKAGYRVVGKYMDPKKREMRVMMITGIEDAPDDLQITLASIGALAVINA